MKEVIADAVSRGWPPTAPAGHHVAPRFNHIDRPYGSYQRQAESLFEKPARRLSRLQQARLDDRQREAVVEELRDVMVRAVYGSNTIQGAGLSWHATDVLCRKVFADTDDTSRIITESDEAFQDVIVEMRRLQPSLIIRPVDVALRARNDIVQHARAYQHILREFVVNKRDLTEGLIKDTHRILNRGASVRDKGWDYLPQGAYGGAYRTAILAASNIHMPLAACVPDRMQQLCLAVRVDVAMAEQGKSGDPFSMAAKHSLRLAHIQPFYHDNMRLSRIILNAILCRFAGVMLPLGEDERAQREYLDAKSRSSHDSMDHGDYAMFVLKHAAQSLREMKKKIAGKGKANTGGEVVVKAYSVSQ
ncbi:hypothetical protein JDV02_004842 [Purpureocillium takamizusanense]|uniref:Fido domain-containing protein n=1 Tax=Purpureocillium takamizusanense TaxID=2060973 RepID=A0A9Q8QGQ4_9HYPO|nr:uncharacterized protein JDV02_004842 [Purpureocillium takamizusanense]UNI18584.1 hypothetical protein JDV02_004842 [Purpureocillium takamizusanense]